jgi:hypothetical protein
MRKYPLAIAIFFTLAVPVQPFGQSAIPQMQTVDPASGRSGDVVAVNGDNLDQNTVAELYLTDGKEDVKVEITEQTTTVIKFKIPANAKTGRLALMVLTKGKDPKLIEEPVKVLIEPPLPGPTG